MPAKRQRRQPAVTEQSRENQLVSLAIDLAEKQLEEGTASSQVVTHYLKLGSTREKLEQERLRRENLLLDSKVESMASAKKVEELYGEALDAMRRYAGRAIDKEDEVEYDEQIIFRVEKV